MPSEALNNAIALARAGKHGEARFELLQILNEDPANETAWMWLVLVLPTIEQRIAALEEWLTVNPNSEKARQGLERIRAVGANAQQPAAPAAPKPAAQKPAEEKTAPAQPGAEPEPPLRQVPRYRPEPPPPPPAQAEAAVPAPAGPGATRSPWVLGKTQEVSGSEVPKGLAEFLRRKPASDEDTENELDLGILAGSQDVNDPAVPRVFTPPAAGGTAAASDEPAPTHSGRIEARGNGAPAQTERGSEDDENILDQLRSKSGVRRRRAPSLPQTRRVVRILLGIFYLVVLILVGYLGLQRYGDSIRAGILSFLNRPAAPQSGPAAASTEMPTPTATMLYTPTTPNTAVPEPTSTPAPVIGERPDPESGWVVYNAPGPSGETDIFAMSPAGGEPQNWTAAISGAVSDPALSSDGRLAYSLSSSDIYLLDPQSGQTTRLTSDEARNREPAWSPDNTRIAFVSENVGNPEIYVMNADGAGVVRLTANPGNDTSPAWSPDGKRIAFVSSREGPAEIFVMNADGSGVTRLTYDLGLNQFPNWSPDGAWIVFSGNRSGDREIYAISPDGGQQNRLTFSPGSDDHPVWSPDGLWILFLSDRDLTGTYNLYAMVRDGTRPFAYFENPKDSIVSPAWARK